MNTEDSDDNFAFAAYLRAKGVPSTIEDCLDRLREKTLWKYYVDKFKAEGRLPYEVEDEDEDDMDHNMPF